MPWWLRNRGVMVLLDIIEYYYHSIFFHDNVWYIIIIFFSLNSYSTIPQPTPNRVYLESLQSVFRLEKLRRVLGYQTDRLIKEQRRRLCTSCEQLLSNHLESQQLRAAVERVSDTLTQEQSLV